MWAYIAGLLWGLAAGITLVVGFRMMHAGTGLYLIALVWTSVIAISCAFLRWSISSSKTPTNEVAIRARTRAQLYAGVLVGIFGAWALALMAGIFLRSIPTGL